MAYEKLQIVVAVEHQDHDVENLKFPTFPLTNTPPLVKGDYVQQACVEVLQERSAEGQGKQSETRTVVGGDESGGEIWNKR